MERNEIPLCSGSGHSAASPIWGIRKPGSDGHNRDAGGGSSFEASKPPKEMAGFIGILMPVQNMMTTSQAKAASHSLEEFMTNLWSSHIFPASCEELEAD